MIGCGPASALVVALLAALSVFSRSASAQQRTDECFAPPPLVALGRPLSHTEERLLHGQPVTIVAIGSSSTAGAGATDRAHSYPSQLARELRRRFPLSRVNVVNKGVNGEQTPDMLARFQPDVFAEHPDLVIWQVGSNEILRKGNADRFRQQVLDGVARLGAHHIETVLMDTQYAPRIIENPNYPAFNSALRKVAQSAHVALFDRFEVMRYWLRADPRRMSSMVASDQIHMTDMGYHCVARLLASEIAAKPPAIAAR